MKKDLQGGLQNILDAINNLIEPKLGNLKYDRTYRGKITSNEGDNTYKVLVNGKEYSAIYTGNKIPVGQIVKVKAPLNNFSDIYIETLPGSGGGEEGDYNSLVNKSILNTNNTETQVAKTAETIQGTISLHKISKTGNYNDLLNKSSLDFIPISEKGQPNGVASLDENGKIVKSDLPADTVYDSNYVHTDNNFTNALKDKLDSVEEGAEPNKIETIQKNGVNLDIVNKTVNVEVPAKTSDILNDSGFLTEIPIASTSRVGGIKVGNNLSITEDGTLNAEAGGVTSYSALTDKPILNTANSSGLSANNNETINGIISLHKISKTGSYEDLLNKPTIPTKTSDLTNDSDFITNTVDNLTNYYLKSETYTQSEVNNLIGQIKTISIEVVDTLPTTGEDNKIYLVPKEGSTGDIYNEYIWVNNAWELIGTTQVDLTGYATEDWVNTQIKDFVTESQVTQIVNNSLTNYYTQTQIDNLLKDKANTSDIPTKTSDLTNDSGFIDNSVDNLVNYYNKTETYNQSEINNLLSSKANTSDIPTKTGDLTNNGDGTTGSKYITNTDLSAGLDSKQDKITGGATTIVSDNLPANKALISNANGKVAVSDTTSAELGYLSGARSNLQGQIDAITTEGGQPNVIEVVQENGTPLEVSNKTVNVIAPTNLVNGTEIGSLRTVGSTEESDTYKLGQYAFAEGQNTVASGDCSHSEGSVTVAFGFASHAEGVNTQTRQWAFTIISGDSTTKTYTLNNITGLTVGMTYGFKNINRHLPHAGTITAIDTNTKAVTVSSYYNLDADDNYLFISDKPKLGDVYLPDSGYAAHSEGNSSLASASASHAEGTETISTGHSSHSEGFRTTADGNYSHSEGRNTWASGYISHAEGQNTVAAHPQSHAEGLGTIANGDNQHVQGKYNISDYTSLDIIGNGTSEDARSNAYTLDRNGNAWYSGDIYTGSTSGTNKDSGSKKIATEEYVDNKTVTDYDNLTNKPTLNTNITTSQPVSEGELITGEMVLHKISKTGDYNDLLNKPTIPTKTSDLTNDSDFINNSVNNLTNYYNKTETYTQTQVDNLLDNKADKREVMVAGVNRKSWTVSESWGKVNLLPLQNNNHSGSGKLTYTTNGIKIGSGVTKVLASALFKGIDYSKFLGDVYVNIVRKRGTNELSGAEVYNSHFDTSYFSMGIPPTMVDVAENDLLYLSLGSGAGGTGEILGASLCVEVLE